MDNVLGTLKGLIRDVTEVGVYLLALGVVAGVLFGPGADGGGGAGGEPSLFQQVVAGRDAGEGGGPRCPMHGRPPPRRRSSR